MSCQIRLARRSHSKRVLAQVKPHTTKLLANQIRLLSVKSAQTIHKFLFAAVGCYVHLNTACDLDERLAELRVNVVCTQTQDFKTTAFRRTIWAKCPNKPMATGDESVLQLRNVRSTLSGVRQEMEYGAIMPEHIEFRGER